MRPRYDWMIKVTSGFHFVQPYRKVLFCFTYNTSGTFKILIHTTFPMPPLSPVYIIYLLRHTIQASLRIGSILRALCTAGA